MKAIRIHKYGGSDVLMHDDIPRPEPNADELLVRVRAASASPIDWKMREGYLRDWFDIPLPTIPGRDFAGDVVEVGANVKDYKVGDAVFGSVGDLHRGTYAEYITVSPNEIAPKPVSIDYVTAAAVPHSGLTAWQALMEAGGLTAGQTVLVHAAAGGVGSYAIQIARSQNANVIGTGSLNLDLVRDLEANDAINYSTANFEDTVKDVDVVLDTIGGDTQERSWGVMKPGGIMVSLIGFSPSSLEKGAALGMRGQMIGQRPDSGHLRSLSALIDAGEIKPVVSMVLPITEVSKAQDILQTGHSRGKVILSMD